MHGNRFVELRQEAAGVAGSGWEAAAVVGGLAGVGGGAGRAASSRSSSSVPAVMQRQVPRCPQIQFIDSGWTFLFCVQRRVPTVQTVQMTVEILQVLLLDRLLTCPLLCNVTCTVLGCQGRRHSCRGADADSYGPDCSEKHRDSPVAVH